MAIGKEKSGKKKKGKEVDGKEKKEKLKEVDKVYYELQLQDIDRKIERLTLRNEELQQENLELDDQIKQLDEETRTVIEDLKKELQTKMDEMTALVLKYEDLKKTFAEGAVLYQEKMALLEEEFKREQEEMSVELEKLSENLRVLEEFKDQKEELWLQFEAKQQEIIRRTKAHKRKVYEMEKEFLVEKQKLKKAVENKVLNITMEFQKETSGEKTLSTQRLSRENISLRRELEKLLAEVAEMDEQMHSSTEQKYLVTLKRKQMEVAVKETIRRRNEQKKIVGLVSGEKVEMESKLKAMGDVKLEYLVLLEELDREDQNMARVNEELDQQRRESLEVYSEIEECKKRESSVKGELKRLYRLVNCVVVAVEDELLSGESQNKEEVLQNIQKLLVEFSGDEKKN